MSSVPETTKLPLVTISLTVSKPGKENMSVGDLSAHVDNAKKLVEAAKAYGSVEGHVTIGKQKFSLAD